MNTLFRKMSETFDTINDPIHKTDDRFFVRMLYYRKNTEDLDCKFDEDYRVRLFYYTRYHTDVDAKKDQHKEVRYIYYLSHPDDTDAMNDTYFKIWGMFMDRNPHKMVILRESTNPMVLLEYYKLYPNDLEIRQKLQDLSII